MELRVLCAHNMESRHTRMESHLIDGVLALDAGNITSALSFDEQQGIRAIILSHRHFDHVRDLPALGLVLRRTGITVDIYAIRDTVEFVTAKLLNGTLFLDSLNPPSPETPTLRLHTVEFYREFKVLDYTVTAVPVPHTVPAAGFQIASGDVSLFYTGDTGQGLSDAWEHVAPTTLHRGHLRKRE
jgi:mRNA degradation ribonuclease J1/J2